MTATAHLLSAAGSSQTPKLNEKTMESRSWLGSSIKIEIATFGSCCQNFQCQSKQE